MAFGVYALVLGLVVLPPMIKRVTQQRGTDSGSFALGWAIAILWFAGALSRLAELRLGVAFLVLAAVGMIALRARDGSISAAWGAAPEA